MDLFKTELQKFLKGESSLEVLESALRHTAGSQPEQLERLCQGLQKMAEAGHLDESLAQDLIESARREAAAVDEVTLIADEVTLIADEDRTQLKTESASAPVDQDQTRVVTPDSDQTVVATGDDVTRIESTSAGSSFTQQTSKTSGTVNTSTTSKWAKPFEDDEQQVQTLTVGAMVKDRFRLLEFIGCGGMGDVFKAEDQRRVDAQDVDTLVAIKVLNNNFRDHPDSLRALQREARKTQNLAHPNIVNVFDFDRDQHHVFMTMELMRGQPLNDVIKANPRGLPADLVFRYVAEMGAALQYAHSTGVIHSDFKPSNIFLDQETVKVFDFGIARAAKEGQQDHFDAGELGALTPTYASPEMLDGELLADPRDDIYALGCISYELLTGKHPFLDKGKKVPADQARERNLSPTPVKGLKRQQWRALKSALAFESDKRTATVAEFLADFLPQQRAAGLLGKWYIWPLAATVVSALAYLPARDLWQQKQLDDLADGLKNGDKDEVLKLLVELEQLPEEEQFSYFNDARVKRSLTQFFIGQMDHQVDQDQYAEAERVAQRALSIYEDSRRLSDQRELISKRKAARLNELNAELNGLLGLSDPEFINAIEQFPVLFKSIARVDIKNPMLTDVRVPDRMIAVIEALAKENAFEPASAVLAIAQQMYPEMAEIRVAKEQLMQRLQQSERDTAVKSLVDELGELDSLESTAQLESKIDLLTQLALLAPDNPELVKARGIAGALVEKELKPMTEQRSWSEARALLAQYQPILDHSLFNRLSQSINDGHQQHEAHLTDVQDQIFKLLDKGQPEQAESLLSQLQSMPEIQQQTAERIGRVWLKQARIARSQQQWQEARQLLAKASEVGGSSDFGVTLREETDLIDSSQAAAELQTAEQLAAERAQRLLGYQSELQAVLQQPLGQATLADTQALLDRVEQLQPDSPLLQKVPAQLGSRYLSDAARLAGAGDAKVALEMLNAFSSVFPADERVRERIGELKNQVSEQDQNARYQALKSDVSALLEQIATDNHWETKLKKLLGQLSAMNADAAEMAAIKTRVALSLSAEAERLSADKRFVDALGVLAKAESYDKNLGTLAGLRQQIQQGQKAWEEEKETRRQQAEVDAVKQTLQTQLKANDLSGAEKSLAQLQAAVGADDPYIVTSVHPAFVDTYLRLADQLARQFRLTKAAELLEGAKKYSADTTVIDDKIQQYLRDAKLWRIGQTVRSMSHDGLVNAHGLLKEIEAELEPERAEKLHSDLITAVVKRFEELKTSQPEAANRLLKKARQLYPDKSQLSSLNLAASTINTQPVKPAVVTPKPKTEEKDEAPVVVSQAPATTAKPPVATAQGKACSASLAGLGRSTRAVCYDMVSAESRAPYLVVVPGNGGSAFAITKFEVSIGEYNQFCQQTGCKVRGGSSKLPVTGISASQAKQYASWLSQTTGHRYSLPTYQQWKHAAYSAGKRQPSNYNCRLMQGSKILKGHGLTAVRTGKANGWGLVNFLGNAQEWVSNGGQVMAAGGHYADPMSSCSVDLVRSGGADSKTGFRLVRAL